MTGASKVDELVHPGGDEALLERQLDAVGQRLQQPPRADPVGAEPHLHAAEDLALEQDRHQHRQQQEHEDAERLGQDQPPRVMAEQRRIGIRHRLCPPDRHDGARRSRRAAGAPRSRRSSAAARRRRSAMSVIASGSVIAPRSVLTVTRSPSAAPISAAVAADSRATGGSGGAGEVRFAVLQPSRVEQHAPAGQHGLTRAGLRGPRRCHLRSARAAAPAHSPRRAISSPAASARRQVEVDADLVGQEVQHPQIRVWRWCAATARTAESGPPS